MFGSATSLMAINAILPEDYRVEVNTSKYNRAISDSVTIKCLACDVEQSYDGVHTFELYLPADQQIITQKKYAPAWRCGSCSKVTLWSVTKTIVKQFEKPFYVKVIPAAPGQTGMISRIGYQEKVKRWFSIALEEVEHQIGLYRADYQSQQEDVDLSINDEDED